MDHTRYDLISHLSKTVGPCVLSTHMRLCLQASHERRGTPSLGVCLHPRVRGRPRALGHGPYYISPRRSRGAHRLCSFQGLTPVLYWRHRDELLTARSSDLPDLVRSLVSSSSHTDPVMKPDQPLCGTPIQRISGRISICNIASLRRPDLLQLYPNVAFLCLAPQDTNHLTSVVVAPSNAFRVLSIQTPEGKKGQHHFLTVVLPRSMPFIHTHLQNLRTVCIACNTGTDTSIGVAVAALAVFFRPDGSLCSQGNARDQLSR